MSLKDGTKKMSKSELSDLSRINLTDEKDQIINKIKKSQNRSVTIAIKSMSERKTRSKKFDRNLFKFN
jgi:tryptophanyl-tRNA synthetase